jgi:hypothetical protein
MDSSNDNNVYAKRSCFMVYSEDLLAAATGGYACISNISHWHGYTAACSRAHEIAARSAHAPNRRLVEFPNEHKPMKSFQVEFMAAPRRWEPIFVVYVVEVTIQ